MTSHHLRVERSGTVTSPEEVAEYFLSFLTLDDIDEVGKRPSIPYRVTEDNQVDEQGRESYFVDVYWDYPFTFEQVEEMCRTTLPEQTVGMDPEEVEEVLGAVWYDGREVDWQPLLAEEEVVTETPESE